MDNKNIIYINHKSLLELVFSIFFASGSKKKEATILATHLVESNLAGHDSHGIIRIPKYLDWLRNQKVFNNRHARIILDTESIIVVSGEYGYGQVIAKEALSMAIERAYAKGIAILAIKESGHLGRIGAWAELTVEKGMASVHFVNTSGFGILVAPHGGSDRRLSANPIAAGIPVKNSSPIILDIATSIIAEGKIQVAKSHHKLLPEGSIINGRGMPTCDADEFYDDPPGAILPFGGHKGFGLSVLCEILAGSLTGGRSSHPENPDANQLNNNMLSIIFDPKFFCGNDFFDNDVSRLIKWIKSSPASSNNEVLMPGEPERRIHSKRILEGIPINLELRTQLHQIALSYGIPKNKIDCLITKNS